MKRRSFASLNFDARKKPTRRKKFLGEMHEVVRTAVSDGKAPCPPDRVHRQSGSIGHIPPAEAEANYHRQLASQPATVVA